MQRDLVGLLMAARTTVSKPREMAGKLIGLHLPVSTGWLALGLMAVISAILSSIATRLFPIEAEAAIAALLGNPVQMVLIQGAVLVLSAMLIQGVGRIFGGKGRFQDALILMAWIEFVLLLLQVAQIVLLVLAPPVAEVLGIVAIGVFLWLLVNFVAELHGFASIGAVLFGIIGTILAISLSMAILMVAVLGLGG